MSRRAKMRRVDVMMVMRMRVRRPKGARNNRDVLNQTHYKSTLGSRPRAVKGASRIWGGRSIADIANPTPRP